MQEAEVSVQMHNFLKVRLRTAVSKKTGRRYDILKRSTLVKQQRIERPNSERQMYKTVRLVVAVNPILH